MAGYSAYLAYADELGFVPQESRYITSPDASVMGLRAFIGFHKDHRQTVELAGKLRTLTHKQVAMHGLISRVAVTGEKATVTALAKEANVVPSTLSRFLDKLEVWHVYAIDRTRGRNGGVRVRLRQWGDQLEAYAARAWDRVKKAAQRALSRSGINVASSIPGGVEDALQVPIPMDATFTVNCDGRWHPLLDCSERDHTPLPSTGTSRAADEEYARAQDFARRTINEIIWLQNGEPDWDVYLDKVRASYGLG